jgi:hypothetical protein
MAETLQIDYHNPRAIREKGFEVLNRELGTVGTIYFLRQFYVGKGDFTEERKTLFATKTMDDIDRELDILRSANTGIFHHGILRSPL